MSGIGNQIISSVVSSILGGSGNNFAGNDASAAFEQAYEINPILLVGGIASGQTGGMSILDLLGSDTFARFIPLNGGVMIDQAVGTYPFANMTVAANAVIANGNVVSLRMICPATPDDPYSSKNAVMTALQASLQKHNASGGYYTVATPALYYPNCIMTSFKDVSGGETKQAQTEWQLDFYQPLLTLAQAEAAQSSLTSKVSNATPVDGDPPTWSGLSTTSSAPPVAGSNAGGSVAPPATPTS